MAKNEKVLVFDLDGTIVDLYGVEGWLDDLHNENTRPYAVAKPLYDMDVLNTLVNELKACGWRIVVNTWLAKNATKAYDDAVRMTKKEWLAKWGFPYDEIHLTKYGRTKANATRHLGGYQILVDDNATIRKGWTLGNTIDANEDIITALMELLINE